METVIEMVNIHKQFKNKTVLSNVSFTVGKGEIYGLLGPSGAGKTTIIKLLTGQLKAESGKAALFGQASTKLTDAEYARIGMVLDESGVYKRLTVEDNMRMFANIYGVDKSYITAAVEKVGLTEAMKRPAEKLSKGMLQRLVLARAILHKPDILFLDEPTSGLDPVTARSIHALLQEQQAAGCTIFLTTHNMEEAAALCGTILLLNEGKVIECGAPDALCRKYKQDNSIHVRLKDGNVVTLENNSAAAGQLAGFFTENNVEAIHSLEPNLETVFIALTGRKLA